MILVAGGTGFLGSAIVRGLVSRGESVALLSHRPEEAASRFAGQGVEIRPGDARFAPSLAAAVRGVDTIVSCMQFPNFPVENAAHGETFEEVDARGNQRLVSAARTAAVRKYCYLSGVGAAPDGRYHWLRSKWRAEEAVRESGLIYTILRPSLVYGPGDHSLNRLAGVARRLPFLPVAGNGNQALQPVFVEDVATACLESIVGSSAANQTLEIGGPDVFTMDEVLKTMLEVMGEKKPLVHTPLTVLRAAGAIAELLPMRSRPLSRDAVTFISMDALADNGPLLSALPELRLTPLRDGLSTYLASQEGPH
jgi:NADH dehydrogenase